LKDPKFKELFFDYLDEISKNPDDKQIYCDQLTAIESLISPHFEFLIISDSGKFINVCSNDKIKKSTSEKSTKNGETGLDFQIPYSCGQMRMEDNSSCWDIVFHQESIKLAQVNPRIMKMLIEICAEAVGSTAEIWDIRKSSGPKGKLVNTITRDDKKTKEKLSKESKDIKSNSNDIKPKPELKTKLKKTKETEPDFKILYQTNHTDFQKFTESPTLRPDSLSIRIHLPKLESANSAVLDVTESSFHLHVKDMYKLDTKLPFQVDTEGTAEFDITTRTLSITVKVLPIKISNHKNEFSNEMETITEGIVNFDLNSQSLNDSNSLNSSKIVEVDQTGGTCSNVEKQKEGHGSDDKSLNDSNSLNSSKIVEVDQTGGTCSNVEKQKEGHGSDDKSLNDSNSLNSSKILEVDQIGGTCTNVEIQKEGHCSDDKLQETSETEYSLKSKKQEAVRTGEHSTTVLESEKGVNVIDNHNERNDCIDDELLKKIDIETEVGGNCTTAIQSVNVVKSQILLNPELANCNIETLGNVYDNISVIQNTGINTLVRSVNELNLGADLAKEIKDDQTITDRAVV
jgi:hypothetical protein